MTRRNVLTQGVELHMLTQVDRMLQATRGNTHRRPPRIDRDPPPDHSRTNGTSHARTNRQTDQGIPGNHSQTTTMDRQRPPRKTPGRKITNSRRVEHHMLTKIDRLITAPWEPIRSRPPWIDIDLPRITPGRKIELSRARRPHIPALAHIDHNIQHATCDVT